MKKKIKVILSAVLSIVFVVLSASCSEEAVDLDEANKILCRNLYINNKISFSVIEYDFRENDDGSVEQYYVFEFTYENGTEFLSQVMPISDWKNAPVYSKYYNICTYVTPIPECTIKRAANAFSSLNSSDSCVYFFKNRSRLYRHNRYLNRKSDSSGRNRDNYLEGGTYSTDDSVEYSKYASNFSIAFFDKSTNRLYIYVYDSAK